MRSLRHIPRFRLARAIVRCDDRVERFAPMPIVQLLERRQIEPAAGDVLGVAFGESAETEREDDRGPWTGKRRV
jgi:hypothetical protein